MYGRPSWGCAPRWYEAAPLALWWLVGPPVWNESELGVECSIPHIGLIVFDTIFVQEHMKHDGDYRAEGPPYTSLGQRPR